MREKLAGTGLSFDGTRLIVKGSISKYRASKTTAES